MLRWLTAGESHGPSLVAILEGLPAHVRVTSDDVADALARRRLGYGRGARMKFEQDEVTLLGGVRHGITQGGPIAVQVGNTESSVAKFTVDSPVEDGTKTWKVDFGGSFGKPLSAGATKPFTYNGVVNVYGGKECPTVKFVDAPAVTVCEGEPVSVR